MGTQSDVTPLRDPNAGHFTEEYNDGAKRTDIDEEAKDVGEFSRDPKMVFKDISNEETRMYGMSIGNDLKISQPVAVNINADGNHRVVCGTGMSFYIPRARDGVDGWTYICWRPKEGRKPFDF